MGTRRKSREYALQMLFQADMGRQSAEDVRRTFWAERSSIEDGVRGFADDIFRLAMNRNADIDQLIDRHTQHWRMERMATVDRNVLRAAVAEVLQPRIRAVHQWRARQCRQRTGPEVKTSPCKFPRQLLVSRY